MINKPYSSWFGTIIWSSIYTMIAVYVFGGGIFEQVCSIVFIGWSVYLIYCQYKKNKEENENKTI